MELNLLVFLAFLRRVLPMFAEGIDGKSVERKKLKLHFKFLVRGTFNKVSEREIFQKIGNYATF